MAGKRIEGQGAAKAGLSWSMRPQQLLVACVSEYAMFRLTEQGEIANWNPGARRIVGYEADEIVGRHFSVFYTDDDRKHHGTRLRCPLTTVRMLPSCRHCRISPPPRFYLRVRNPMAAIGMIQVPQQLLAAMFASIMSGHPDRRNQQYKGTGHNADP